MDAVFRLVAGLWTDGSPFPASQLAAALLISFGVDTCVAVARCPRCSRAAQLAAPVAEPSRLKTLVHNIGSWSALLIGSSARKTAFPLGFTRGQAFFALPPRCLLYAPSRPRLAGYAVKGSVATLPAYAPLTSPAGVALVRYEDGSGGQAKEAELREALGARQQRACELRRVQRPKI